MEQSLVKYEQWPAKVEGRSSVRVLGIDLGTTNSTVCEIHAAGRTGALEARCLELEQPTPDGIYTSPLVPSVVAILPSDGAWVGEGAKRLRARPQEANLIPEKNLFFETKNEMGLRKTYYRAPEGYNAPWKIGGQILSFLKQAAFKAAGARPDRVVVTVPASFQLNQRRDTIQAARMAGIELKDYDLLDEPTAALIGYWMGRKDSTLFTTGASSCVMVMDFGGGTCDVSIVDMEQEDPKGGIKASMKMTSRYHRLGGGDLDCAIVHDHLIPMLLKENSLPPRDLSWAEKKRGLEPQLLGTAEALKIALCREIDRLTQFGKYAQADKKALAARQPAVACRLGKRELRLSTPSLSAAEFEAILKPFLDTEVLFARETEYRLSQSIFAPIQDALDRAQLKSGQVDVVLLVGGSTLIPQVKEAVGKFFSKARVCAFDDPMDAQLAVARGAAWHAFHLEATGMPLICPVVPDTIALVTGKGEPYPLVPAGAALPYPSGGAWAEMSSLVIPKAMLRELKLEVIALSSGQPMLCETWHIKELVDTGEPITLLYRLGTNGELVFRAFLTNHPGEEFAETVQNPLVNAIHPNSIRLQIEDLEETLREKGGPSAEDVDDLVSLARLYAEMRHYERAVDYLRNALRLLGKPEPNLLNLQGIYYGEMRDTEHEARCYLEADQAAPGWGGPMFNLALMQLKTGRLKEALISADAALAKEPYKGPNHTLKGDCLRALGRKDEAMEVYRRAVEYYAAPEGLDDWALGWYKSNMDMLGRRDLVEKAEAERTRRKSHPAAVGEDGIRPVIGDGLRVMN